MRYEITCCDVVVFFRPDRIFSQVSSMGFYVLTQHIVKSSDCSKALCLSLRN